MRTKLSNITEKELDKTLTVCGWIRSIRKQKTFSFIELNDGSKFASFQIVVDESIPDYEAIVTQLKTGSSISIEGLIVKSPAKGQNLEMSAKK